MFTDSVAPGVSITNTIQRRGVGKAAWKRVIHNLIASEKEDMVDLATLRRKTTDPESLRIIAELLQRKTIRVIELTELLHYKDKDGER